MDADFIRSPLLSRASGIRHAFFTRRGGVSAGPYASLNAGRGSEDDPAAVAENLERAAAVFDLGSQALNVCYQIHSATVVVADRPWATERPLADGVITRTPGVICGALAADCAPVLIAEPRARVVAAVHAGWRGALAGIVGAAVDLMTKVGAEPSRMVAAVGPCIAQASYEVDLAFAETFEAQMPGSLGFFAPGVSAAKWRFDLPGFVLARLAAAGVGACEWVGQDTYADDDAWFSNRRALHRGERDYGRLLSAIMLEG